MFYENVHSEIYSAPFTNRVSAPVMCTCDNNQSVYVGVTAFVEVSIQHSDNLSRYFNLHSVSRGNRTPGSRDATGCNSLVAR